MGTATIEKAFPKIRKHGYKITSQETADYNCFAWGLRIDSEWVSPSQVKGYSWPDGVPKTLELKSFIQLYEIRGKFSACSNDKLEPKFEKVAIYCDQDGEVTHVARQLSSGEWASKLGDWEDVERDTLEALEGDFYGKAVQIMKRPVT